jgi:hypothetical protein
MDASLSQSFALLAVDLSVLSAVGAALPQVLQDRLIPSRIRQVPVQRWFRPSASISLEFLHFKFLHPNVWDRFAANVAEVGDALILPHIFVNNSSHWSSRPTVTIDQTVRSSAQPLHDACGIARIHQACETNEVPD